MMLAKPAQRGVPLVGALTGNLQPTALKGGSRTGQTNITEGVILAEHGDLGNAKVLGQVVDDLFSFVVVATANIKDSESPAGRKPAR